MIQHDGKYYDMLHKIDYEQGKDLNGQGFVALTVPFKNAEDAVTFIMTDFPELTPASYAIAQDKAECRKLAGMIRPEVERLLHCVERMKSVSSEKLEQLREQRDSLNDRDFLESVRKKGVQEDIMRQIGYFEALSDVWNLLHNRKYELFECVRLKGGKTDVQKS